jgi:hypothetical protein
MIKILITNSQKKKDGYNFGDAHWQEARDIESIEGSYDIANIVGIDLSESKTPVTDETSSLIARMSSLQVLIMSETDISNIHFVKNIQHLCVLEIAGTNVSDISALNNLKELQVLIAHDTPLRDLSPLTSATKLTKLKCERTKITDLSPLNALYSLIEIDLHGCEGIKDLSPLKNLCSLKEVYIQDTGILFPEQLEPLLGLKLTRLMVDYDLQSVADHILNMTKIKNNSPFTSELFPTQDAPQNKPATNGTSSQHKKTT